MRLGLYVCTLLTHSSAPWKSGGSRPVYPKENQLDCARKVEIFIRSLRSLAGVGIGKILLNLEYAPEVGDHAPKINDAVRMIFPQAEIIHGPRRPTSLAHWIESSRIALEFFGADTPIICLFNHDHIFTDPVPEVFQGLVEQVFRERPDVFLSYSHSPEANSYIRNAPAYRSRLSASLGIELASSAPVQLYQDLYYVEQQGFIDSIFVASARSLSAMWAAARSEATYIPRPDWAGAVTFPHYSFKVILPRREFFRHFDGYGHVTGIPELQGLRLSDFDAAGDYSRRTKVRSWLSIREPDDGVISNLASEYERLFREVHLLSLRDEHFAACRDGNRSFRMVEHLNEALETFMRVQVTPDLNFFRCPEGFRARLITCLAGKVFSRQIEIFNLCHADVLMIPERISNYRRFRGRFSRLLRRAIRVVRIIK